VNELQHLHRWTVGRVQQWHKSLYVQTAGLAVKVCQKAHTDKKLNPGHKIETTAIIALKYKFHKNNIQKFSSYFIEHTCVSIKKAHYVNYF
jgi:hypothetical protein